MKLIIKTLFSWWVLSHIHLHFPSPSQIVVDPCLVFMMSVSVLITWLVMVVNHVCTTSQLSHVASVTLYSEFLLLFVSTNSDFDSQIFVVKDFF